MYSQCFLSPVGDITVRSDGEYIIGISFEKSSDGKGDELTATAVSQLKEYFAGKRRDFAIPIKPHGTTFQLSVWDALLKVGYGETASYRDIANKVGCRCFRAIGGANKKNPIAIVIPCHRIIASDGSLGGYASVTDKKKILLEIEKIMKIPSVHYEQGVFCQKRSYCITYCILPFRRQRRRRLSHRLPWRHPSACRQLSRRPDF